MIESNSPNKRPKIVAWLIVMISAFALGVGLAYILTLLAHKIS
jgi:hypothetical protein